MKLPDERRPSPAALKAAIEAADRAAGRGAPGEALRWLLGARSAPIAPDHDHTCSECGAAWSHLDEPCGDLAAPVRCGDCEVVGDGEPELEGNRVEDVS